MSDWHTPEIFLAVIGMAVTNLGVIVAGYIKIRERITRIETHLSHILGKLHMRREEDKE